jgi:hypothetical protein
MTMSEQEKLIQAFDKFRSQIDAAYDQARICLLNGQLTEAQAMLAKIAQVHAKTSLSMRAYLIRNGLLPTED